LAEGGIQPGLARKDPVRHGRRDFAALNLFARLHPSQSWTKPVSLEEFGPGSRAMQSFYIWANYLWKEFWPADLSP
jgi:hypothetical protein